MISRAVSELWFSSRARRPLAALQLFCLPYAGGGASVFAAWPRALGENIEVNAVALPGRERRMAEEPAVDLRAVAEAIAARADRPYALFGHSMGAILAFEVARELRRAGSTLPVRLFVSGCQAPDLPRVDIAYAGLSEADDDELLDRLVAGGGLPAEIMAERELLALLIPVFRADFVWLDGYVYREEPALPIPVTAFAGADDESAPPEAVDHWRTHTTADFGLHVLSGGHFFLKNHLDTLGEVICADSHVRVQTGPATPAANRKSYVEHIDA